MLAEQFYSGLSIGDGAGSVAQVFHHADHAFTHGVVVFNDEEAVIFSGVQAVTFCLSLSNLLLKIVVTDVFCKCGLWVQSRCLPKMMKYHECPVRLK